MLKFLFGLIFLCVATLLGWIAFTKDNFCIFCTFRSDSSSLNSNAIQGLLVDDLKLAKQNSELPEMWGQIKEVRYLYHSKRVQKTLNNSPILAINKSGDKSLLVEFYDEPDSTQYILVRYNILDIASGNTVGEINRRLKLAEDPKEKKTSSTKK